MERLHALHEELRELLSADSPDESAIMAKADEIGAVKTSLKKHHLRTMLQIRSQLTPEQREKLVELHEERRERWKEKRERWREQGPDPDSAEE